VPGARRVALGFFTVERLACLLENNIPRPPSLVLISHRRAARNRAKVYTFDKRRIIRTAYAL
jgi:hypothetical protein